MRLLLTSILAFALTQNSLAQLVNLLPDQTYPNERFSIGIVFTDLMVNRFRMEGSYRVKGPQVLSLGLGAPLGRIDMDNRPFQSNTHNITGIYTNASYKYYFYSSNGNKFSFARVHFEYQNADIAYQEKDWVVLPEGELNYYYYRDVNRIYHVENIGIGMEAGIELKGDVFFTEFAFGVKVRNVVSNDQAPEEFTTYNGHFFSDVDYSGVVPTLGIKMGFYLD